MAYNSDESGAPEIYIRPKDEPGKERVSTSGGSQPRWSRNAGELFYIAPSRTLMALEVRIRESLSVSAPKALFQTCAISDNISSYDVALDGKRFIFACQSENKKSVPLRLQFSGPQW